jgi:hypothetical protein
MVVAGVGELLCHLILSCRVLDASLFRASELKIPEVQIGEWVFQS